MKEAIKKLKLRLKQEFADKCRSQEVRNIKKQIKNIEDSETKDDEKEEKQ